MENPSATLLRKIETRSAKICIVGLGYVGVPLAVASAEAGFQVIGVDVDKTKVQQVNSGTCYVEDAYSERLLPSLVKQRKIWASMNLDEQAEHSDVIIVCVPTPLNEKEEPDLSYVKSVAKSLSRAFSRFKLVILESTSFPGTTENIVKPILERAGKTATRDFALVYSPERIDYGNPRYSVKDIAKIVGGLDPQSTRLGAAFYESILKAPVVKVSSPSVAEAAKILENIFRYVNIGLVNELSVLHEELGVDFIEAIGAAATKPFGFMAHYPGPGIGGHCIPKDPFYLVYRKGCEQDDAPTCSVTTDVGVAEVKETGSWLDRGLVGFGLQGRGERYQEEPSLGGVEAPSEISGPSQGLRPVRLKCDGPR